MGEFGTGAARRRGLPLWVRIAAASVLSFLAATTAAGLWVGARASELAEREVVDGLRADLEMLLPTVRRALAEGNRDLLAALVGAPESEHAVRLTVILADGRVVAESQREMPPVSHGERPEVRAALAGGEGSAERLSSTTGKRSFYLARRVDDASGRTIGVLRLARPLEAVDSLDREILRALVLSVLLGLPVAALVGWIAARRTARPLEAMTEAAARMAAGDFSRLPRATRADESGRLAEALGHLGRELAEMLRVREQGRTELTAILESMSEGVLALDRDSRVVHANAAVAACLGLPSVPPPGTSLAEIVRLPEISEQLRSALGGKAAPERDVVLPGPAGRVLGVGAAPIAAGDGAVRGALLVLRDVTVIRRLERTRLDFVANVSHELRTPLAAVQGAVETLRELGDEDPETRRLLLDAAHRHTLRLGTIVDDLLALSQIESEGDRLERGPVPLLRGLRGAAGAVAGEARARGVTLVLPPSDAPDVVVVGNEGRLEQVWTNLLANAVKYNRPDGSVAVEVSRDDAARMAVVTVRDTGPGIPAEHLPRIFERFYRVDRGRSRDQGGTGLGLAIVKHIVLSHRGRIDVESRPGAGSAFRVRIPMAEPNLTSS